MSIEYHKEGRIAIITINRPEVLNALSPEALNELTNVLISFRDDPQLSKWCVIG